MILFVGHRIALWTYGASAGVVKLEWYGFVRLMVFLNRGISRNEKTMLALIPLISAELCASPYVASCVIPCGSKETRFPGDKIEGLYHRLLTIISQNMVITKERSPQTKVLPSMSQDREALFMNHFVSGAVAAYGSWGQHHTFLIANIHLAGTNRFETRGPPFQCVRDTDGESGLASQSGAHGESLRQTPDPAAGGNTGGA